MPQSFTRYDTLMMLFQPAPWREVRHRSTLGWMVVGLLTSGGIALDEWVPEVAGRAVYAQRTVRRCRRGRSNRRIPPLRRYAGWRGTVRRGFEAGRLPLALDPTVLWNERCVVQVALVWRGRAGPLAWKVLRHGSASVAFRDYRGVLGCAARRLKGRAVVLLADRGVLHAEWLRWTRTVGWHY